MTKMWTRISMTVAILFATYVFEAAIIPPILVEAADAAGKQLLNSNDAYVISMWKLAALRLYKVLYAISFALIVMTWWEPIKTAFMAVMEKISSLALVLAAASMLFANVDAKAYYAVSDYTEMVYITPNQTCFWVPDIGNNKDSQQKFMSESYLHDNKVAAKAFKIEHTTLSGSGTTALTNKVIPAGRLLCVERTPWARRWTADPSTGTSSRNDSFQCQSSEGITARIDLAVSAVVTEETAHTYLYWFSTKKPDGDPKDPATSFQSVLYARDMSDVMDNFVMHSIVPAVCGKFASRTVDQINGESAKMMSEAQNEVTAILKARGIVLLSLGWGNINFDRDIQGSIDSAFAASKMKPFMDVLVAKADIEMKLALAKALESKGIPMPSNLAVIPQNFFSELAKSVTSGGK